MYSEASSARRNDRLRFILLAAWLAAYVSHIISDVSSFSLIARALPDAYTDGRGEDGENTKAEARGLRAQPRAACVQHARAQAET